jgi:hypothetical protein
MGMTAPITQSTIYRMAVKKSIERGRKPLKKIKKRQYEEFS